MTPPTRSTHSKPIPAPGLISNPVHGPATGTTPPSTPRAAPPAPRPAVRFERATPANAYVLTVLSRAFFPYRRFAEDKIRKRIENPRVAYVLARVDGKTAGFVHVEFGAAGARVKGIAVLPEYRRQGIGERLFKRALHEIRARGAARVTVMVDPFNQPAMKLYENLGFRYWRKSGKILHGEEMILLSRNLRPKRTAFAGALGEKKGKPKAENKPGGRKASWKRWERPRR